MSDTREIEIEAMADGRLYLAVKHITEGAVFVELTHSQAREVYYMLHRITGGDYADGM